MDAWTRTLRMVAIVPAMVVSTEAWLIAAALSPAGLGGLVPLVAPVMLGALWLGKSGRAGGLVDQVGALLANAREPTSDELRVLRPVLARLVELEVNSMRSTRAFLDESTNPSTRAFLMSQRARLVIERCRVSLATRSAITRRLLVHTMTIDGKAAQSVSTFGVVNPATGEVDAQPAQLTNSTTP